jgi:hypothetical protein
LPPCGGKSALDDCEIYFVGNFSPDSHEGRPGLLAYLQEAGATKVFFDRAQ